MNIQTITMIAALLSAALPAHALPDATTVPYQDPTPKFARPGDFAGSFVLRGESGGLAGYLRPVFGGVDSGPEPGFPGGWVDLEGGVTYAMTCQTANPLTGRCSCLTPEPGRTLVQFSSPQSGGGPFYRAVLCFYQN